MYTVGHLTMHNPAWTAAGMILLCDHLLLSFGYGSTE